MYFLATQQKLELSEQQIVDCNSRNFGCNGGQIGLVYEYAKENFWESSSSYPYKGMQKDCRHKLTSGNQVLNDYKTIHGLTQMLEMIQIGPIAGAVNANNMQYYIGGVFSSCSGEPNHAVQIVGIDTENNWIVKNSWGPGWGNAGYITIKAGNTCGVAIEGFQPYV